MKETNPEESNSVIWWFLNSHCTPNKHSVRLHLGAGTDQLGSACALRLGRIRARAVTKGQTGRHFSGKLGAPQLTLNSCTRGPAKVEGENKGVINHTLPASGTTLAAGGATHSYKSNCKITEFRRYSLQRRPGGTKRE